MNKDPMQQIRELAEKWKIQAATAPLLSPVAATRSECSKQLLAILYNPGWVCVPREDHQASRHCQCPSCMVTHASDCAVHNMPASPNGACDCGKITSTESEAMKYRFLRDDAFLNSPDAFTEAGNLFKDKFGERFDQAIEAMITAAGGKS